MKKIIYLLLYMSIISGIAALAFDSPKKKGVSKVNMTRFKDTDLLSVVITVKTAKDLYNFLLSGSSLKQNDKNMIMDSLEYALDPSPSHLGDPAPDVTQ